MKKVKKISVEKKIEIVGEIKCVCKCHDEPSRETAGWEERFEKEFPWLSSDVLVSEREKKDSDTAMVLTDIIRFEHKRVKSFIRSELLAAKAEGGKEMLEKAVEVVERMRKDLTQYEAGKDVRLSFQSMATAILGDVIETLNSLSPSENKENDNEKD